MSRGLLHYESEQEGEFRQYVLIQGILGECKPGKEGEKKSNVQFGTYIVGDDYEISKWKYELCS